MFNTAADREWEEWQKVCKTLLETGAVTQEDLNTSVSAPVVTNGQKILNAIRKWGDKVETLAIENYKNN